MSQTLSQLYTLLADVVLPNLRAIQASQIEQRMETDRLNRNIEEFRAEMQLRFVELRAEITACRTEVEDAMVTLRDTEVVEAISAINRGKKTMIN